MENKTIDEVHKRKMILTEDGILKLELASNSGKILLKDYYKQ